MTVDGYFGTKEDHLALFFVEADVSKARDPFSKLNLQYAPVVTLVPPKIDRGDQAQKTGEFFLAISVKYRFSRMPLRTTARVFHQQTPPECATRES